VLAEDHLIVFVTDKKLCQGGEAFRGQRRLRLSRTPAPCQAASRSQRAERLDRRLSIAMLVPLGVSSCTTMRRGAPITSCADYFRERAALWCHPFRQGRAADPDGFSWCARLDVLPAFATLPLLIYMPSSVSRTPTSNRGSLTTTGSTLLSGLDKLPPSINLWRCELQWLAEWDIVLAVAILPLLGIGGTRSCEPRPPGR